MEDNEILDLFFSRDEKAIRESEIKYGSFCMSIARGILGSDAEAEECVNDTWLKAWNSIPPQNPPNFRMWLGKVIRNLALDRYRYHRAAKRNRDFAVSLEELADCIPLQEEDAGNLTELLNQFLHGLELRDQQLFVGRYWYNYSLEKLSNGYGMPVSTVSHRLSRTRDKLKQFLEKEGYSL